MISVVCWKWRPAPGYRSTYGPETVNVLRAMVARHYQRPHRFLCVTDDPAGIDADVEIVPAWNDFATVESPHGKRNPSCYRRLRMFHPEIADVFGERFVSLDLDAVLVNDVSPLWDRPDDFVAWGDTNPQPKSYYNGSMILMRAGSRSQLWTQFDPHQTPAKTLEAGCWGSDQGWLSYCLGPGEAKWSRADGVYSFRNDLNHGRVALPNDARIVLFHGRLDPWSPECQHLPWVRRHYTVKASVAA
jgi:hypothetical protein